MPKTVKEPTAELAKVKREAAHWKTRAEEAEGKLALSSMTSAAQATSVDPKHDAEKNKKVEEAKQELKEREEALRKALEEAKRRYLPPNPSRP